MPVKELKALIKKVKEENSGLKLQIDELKTQISGTEESQK